MASKDFMIEFFDVLKNENAIWQTKSEKYKDKLEKQKSWEKLVTKWKIFIIPWSKHFHIFERCYMGMLFSFEQPLFTPFSFSFFSIFFFSCFLFSMSKHVYIIKSAAASATASSHMFF